MSPFSRDPRCSREPKFVEKQTGNRPFSRDHGDLGDSRLPCHEKVHFYDPFAVQSYNPLRLRDSICAAQVGAPFDRPRKSVRTRSYWRAVAA